MSSHAPTDPTRSRGPRMGIILTLVLLAFLGGALLVGLAFRSGWSFGGLMAQRQAAAAAPTATGFQPAQPLTSTGSVPNVDPATLVTREAALAGQLAALETRAAVVATDAAAAGAQATRAEALMVAFAARRAIDKGTPLGYLEEQLRTRFAQAQPKAVAIIVQAAREPVTAEDLRQCLDALAPDLARPASEGWWADLRRNFGNLVVLRPEGTPSPAAEERIARARRLLDDGRVDAARAEVARLPGANDAGAWMSAARRWVLTHQALDVIETAAILGQAQGLQPPLRVVPTQEAAPVVTTEGG